jgi:CheY-like chemotaxis protein
VAAALVLLLAGGLWHSARLRAEVGRTRLAQAEAELRAEHQRRFTGVLAHEVRNALHGVVAGVELLRPALARTPAAPGTAPGLQPAELGAQLEDSAQGTLRLLNDLIDRERLHQGRLVLREGAVQLAPLLQAVADGLAAAAALRNQVLVVTLPADAPALWLDGLRLQQLVRNLLANAVKYAGPGEIELAAGVEPTAAPEGLASLWVEVRDRGPGLPAPATAPAPSTLALDSGLGLALCRELAALMHARLDLEARTGGGLLARLALQARWLAAAPPAAPAEAGAGPEAVAAAGQRVLVVEDAAAYALLLQRAFELRGHPVRLAGRVDAACSALNEAPPPQLLLSDLHLEGDDIHPLLERWRTLAPAERPCLVLMTADLETLPPALDPARTGVPVLEKGADVRPLVDAALALTQAQARARARVRSG